jgi:hypothetical protein
MAIIRDNSPEREADLQIIIQINHEMRSSKAIRLLRGLALVADQLVTKWQDRDSYVSRMAKQSLKNLESQIKKIEKLNTTKSRLQGLRYKTAREVENLITDGTLSRMNIEIAQLRETVKRQQHEGKYNYPDATPESKAAATKQYEEIQKAQEAMKSYQKDQEDTILEAMSKYHDKPLVSTPDRVIADNRGMKITTSGGANYTDGDAFFAALNEEKKDKEREDKDK